ncbi:MAG: indolepyruvate oxidoreductase [Candidatus Altiarchaeota archaeon]|nr:indolepyruvate oxidoreductase [Candidatus Altiarchaeota archaeon]
MTERRLLSGNEAIARGAIDAGISIATSYPGTPSTEILEYIAANADGIHAEWSVNEKVALETAIGASYSGVRAICSMKHVGVNVAADPLMTLAYTGVKGGLVLVAADDPGMHSSQNEQDSRHYVKAAKILCLEPCDSQEAYDMSKEAFNISEETKLPIMLRTMTRISHTSSPVNVEKAEKKKKPSLEIDAREWVMVPANARVRHKVLNEKQPLLRELSEGSRFNKVVKKGNEKKGIIAFGSAYNYVGEFYDGRSALLRVSTYPFPMKMINEFLEDLEKVIVLEEGDPLLEEAVRCLHSNVHGRLNGEVPLEGELTPEIAAKVLGKGTPGEKKPGIDLPPRPPRLCPGCPHQSLYNALKKVETSIITGDIGCYTLGVRFGTLHTCLCMGAGISQAAGISHTGIGKVAAVIGESTFLHSGITALMNAVYNKANMLVIIMDNSAVAMTGHQPTPLTGVTATGDMGGKITLEEIVKSCNVASVDVVDPYKEVEVEKLLRKRLDEKGVKVVISRGPCIIIKKRMTK